MAVQKSGTCRPEPKLARLKHVLSYSFHFIIPPLKLTAFTVSDQATLTQVHSLNDSRTADVSTESTF